MTRISRPALRTTEPTGRLSYRVSPTPIQDDNRDSIADSQPAPAAPSRVPVSDGSLAYSEPVISIGLVGTTIPQTLGNVAGVNNLSPQIISREA